MFNSRGLRNGVLVAAAALLAAGGVWAGEAAKKTRRGGAAAGMMWAIPARSLVCVRINRFDATLDSVNAYLKDVAPGDPKTAMLSKLTKLLGDEQLRGVNKKGNIAIFVVNVQSDPPSPGPMGNMFAGVLVPVSKYENFVLRNPNVGEADEQGISTITVDGKPMALAMNFRRFALLCWPNARGQLAQVEKLLNQRKRSLGASLDAEMVKQSASSPVWVYLNVKEGSQMLQPMLQGGLQQMKAQLEKAQKTGEAPPIDPAGIVAFYGEILKTVLEGTDNVTVAVAPSAEACEVTLGLRAVPDSMMATMVGKPLEGDLNSVLGYLEDGAMFNVAAKVDHENLKTTYLWFFKLMGKMIPGGLGEADIQQLEELMTKGIDAMGDSLAVTANVDSEATPPFLGKYVIAVKDRQAFEEVLEKSLQLMEKGVFADMYKGFGMEMDTEINRDAGTYKGAKIGAAKVAFKVGGENAMQAKMFEKLFGDGLEYRWAFEGGNCVYTVGGDADGAIRELIDQVRAGGPSQIGSETRAALAAMEDSGKADVVGTFNFVRYMRMVAGFMFMAQGADVPQFDVTSESNIAFAARTTSETDLAFQFVVPRQHLLEIKSVFENVIPKIKEQERLQRDKQKERAQSM